MADRVILLKDGRVEQAGTPSDLYDRPASSFVAGFIGTPPMNLVPARRQDGGIAPQEGTSGTPELLLGIRPEHVTLAGEGREATVEGQEYFGADTVVTCRLGGHKLLARVAGRPDLAPGAAVRLTWPATAEHLFDARTGRRIDN